MRLLYVIHALYVGGAESVTVNYLKKLKERGENVALLELEHTDSFLSDEVKELKIPYYSLLNGSLRERIINKLLPGLAIKRFNQVICEFNPDVIHFHTIYRNIEKLRFPIEHCVFTYHARVERNYMIGKWVNPLLERLSKTDMRFIAISSKVEDDVRTIYPSARYQMIPNGVNLGEIRKHSGERSAVREELGISDDRFVLGQVGRFNKVKNHLFTIDVFKIIAQRDKNALLVLIGTGNEQEKHMVEKKISDSNLQEKVLMLGLRDDATRLMTGFDAMILPSLSESFSLVLIEAQANNVKCVASDAIPSEVICTSNSHQLSLEDAKETWADVITTKKENNIESKIEQFDINNVVDKHIKLYQSMLK